MRRDGPRLPLALAAAAVALLGLLARVPRFAYHWDELQLAYGARAFDLSRHHPHPPGYYLYVKASSLFTWIHPEDPLVATKIVALASAVGWAFLVSWQLPAALSRGSRAGWSVGLGLLSWVCFAWYGYGSVGLSYASEALVFTGLLLAVSRRPSSFRAQLSLMAAIGFGAGVRPTILPWLLLVLALVWLRDRSWVPVRRWPACAAAGAAGVLLWWGPMILESGGLEAYRDATRLIVRENVWAKSVFVDGFSERWAARFPHLLPDLLRAVTPVLPFFGFGVVLRFRRTELVRDLDPLLVGAGAALLTYVLVIYDTGGYMLAVAAPLQAWSILAVARWHAERSSREESLALAGAGAISLLLAQLTTPAELREVYERNDALMGERLEIIRDRVHPRDGVVVFALENWHFGLRHAGEYLREYASIQLISDRFFGIVDRERAPYLRNLHGEIEATGPGRLPLSALVDADHVRHVLLADPYKIRHFVHPGCARYAERIDLAADQQMALFTLPEGVEAWIDHEWLVCGREMLGQAPPFEHGLDIVR